jgi:hypothetical protein
MILCIRNVGVNIINVNVGICLFASAHAQPSTDGRHTSDGVRMILHQAQRLGHGQIGLVRASDNSEAAVARALIGQQVLSHSEA